MNAASVIPVLKVMKASKIAAAITVIILIMLLLISLTPTEILFYAATLYGVNHGLWMTSLLPTAKLIYVKIVYY